MKQYLIAFGFLAFAVVDVVVYAAILPGHDSSPLLFVSMFMNVVFLAVALTKGKEPIPSSSGFVLKRKASRKMKLIGGVLVTFSAINIMFTARRGTSLNDKDSYYIKTLSGKHIEISRQEYEDLSKLQTRLFSGTWLAINLAFAPSFLLRE